MLRTLLLGLCFAPAALPPVFAEDAPANPAKLMPPLLQKIAFDPQLNAALPLELTFRDEAGRTVRLGDYFGKKPVVLALVYYQCPMLCTQVLNGLVSSLKVLSFNAGGEYDVVAVSIHPRETPALALAKKLATLERYKRPGAANGWHFLTGDEGAIAALARAASFGYAYDPATDLYAHASGILVLTPQGRISRAFYGIEYAPRDLRLGLVEASANKIGTPADRVLLFCYQYDPATGKYGALVIRLVRLGGVATLLALGVFIFVARRREGRERLTATPGAG